MKVEGAMSVQEKEVEESCSNFPGVSLKHNFFKFSSALLSEFH